MLRWCIKTPSKLRGAALHPVILHVKHFVGAGSIPSNNHDQRTVCTLKEIMSVGGKFCFDW